MFDPNAEFSRLAETRARTANWRRWGTYLPERQWGIVREDYSDDGNAWYSITHDQARSTAYRWGEDGLLGWTDRECRLCFAPSLWNGNDPILKERLFGVPGPEGNHGEDVKECYYYLDATPTHSYCKALYKYPQAAFPYATLSDMNRERGKHETEFELTDTRIFDEERYFDVTVEYAKDGISDILIRLTIENQGPEAAMLSVLPTVWFRNTWIWGDEFEGRWGKPEMRAQNSHTISMQHSTLGHYLLVGGNAQYDHGGCASPSLLFTDNETNPQRFSQRTSANSTFYKDAFHEYTCNDRHGAVNTHQVGTKACMVYELDIAAGGQAVITLRLCNVEAMPDDPLGPSYDQAFAERIAEADAFYEKILPDGLHPEEYRVARQAYAGLLWTKQFYYYNVESWLKGDPALPAPADERRLIRNGEWGHLFNRDIISMPDKWEYPWYAAWDLAFHMLPFTRIDPDYAKDQLELFLREWYMHPNGQIPAYEYNFSDVNPPVHAWACWRVYRLNNDAGNCDRDFLSRTFQKLLLNFTWWVNRKDPEGRNVFGGGFLGLDNIGVFDRSRPLPTGGHLEQADGTAWMAFYCGTMLAMGLELASENRTYSDMASKFFEHFVGIIDAMNRVDGEGLWDEDDQFYYDHLRTADKTIPLRTRSLVGLIPLIAVQIIQDDVLEKLPGFRKRMDWFLENRPHLSRHITVSHHKGKKRYLLALCDRDRLKSILRYLLDENEFLAPYGIRSLSRYHRDHPYVFKFGKEEHRVDYTPGESDSGLFGGNSNWRGPIWYPINYLLIEALKRYHAFYGDDFTIEYPTGSGNFVTLDHVARDLHRRLTLLFLPNAEGERPCHGTDDMYADNPNWKDLVLFYEHFHGDSGRGLGASHQTGWTALVIRSLEELAGYVDLPTAARPTTSRSTTPSCESPPKP